MSQIQKILEEKLRLTHNQSLGTYMLTGISEAVKAEEKQSEVCENCDERYTSVSGFWGNRKYCKIDGHRIENSKRYGCIDFRRKEGKDE